MPESVIPPHLRRQYIQFSDEDSKRSQVILLDSRLLQIKMLIVPNPAQFQNWDYADCYRALCSVLLGSTAAASWISAPRTAEVICYSSAPPAASLWNANCGWKSNPISTKPSLPPQTDIQDLGMKVLDRVHKGHFICYENAAYSAHYAMCIKLPTEQASVDLSLSINFIKQTASTVPT